MSRAHHIIKGMQGFLGDIDEILQRELPPMTARVGEKDSNRCSVCGDLLLAGKHAIVLGECKVLKAFPAAKRGLILQQNYAILVCSAECLLRYIQQHKHTFMTQNNDEIRIKAE